MGCRDDPGTLMAGEASGDLSMVGPGQTASTSPGVAAGATDAVLLGADQHIAQYGAGRAIDILGGGDQDHVVVAG